MIQIGNRSKSLSGALSPYGVDNNAVSIQSTALSAFFEFLEQAEACKPRELSASGYCTSTFDRAKFRVRQSTHVKYGG